MSPEDALFSIAEVGIGLAGFSGLVAAFSQRAGQTWSSGQKTRIVFLIVLSFGMIIASLSPYALAGISESPAIVWGIPMVLYAIVSLSLVVYWLTKAKRHGYVIHFPIASFPIVAGATVLQVVVLLSGLGLIYPYSPTLFVFGFLSILAFGANVFLALLHSIWSE